MRARSLPLRGLVLLLAATATPVVTAQTPLGTVFTYQGRLETAGSPAGGLHDLRFRLYDASAGGAQVGATACFDNVSVTDGVFTVPLDFGAQFDGQERFLEIEVRVDAGMDCADATGFVVLAPRQALAATPYALYARSVPVPLALSGNVDGFVLSAVNTSAFTPTGAISGESTAVSGTTYGVRGESDSSSGRGVQGYASRTSGINYGVHGSTESASGRGVFGQAFHASGSTYGGYFLSSSTLGIGAYGLGGLYGVYGESSSSAGRGVYGFASGPGLNNGTGVYGRNDSANGWAVFAQGRSGASGTKSFCIDHPDDPANRFLLHYAAESPDVINFYSDTVTLDERGEALVELPHYFAKINARPRYQLTAVGAPMPMLHVAEEIDESALRSGATAEPWEASPRCSFRIAGGAPGAKVSWEVKALRNDRWIQRCGAPVEVEKPSVERGTYQHPELFGGRTETGDDAERARPSTSNGATQPPSAGNGEMD